MPRRYVPRNDAIGLFTRASKHGVHFSESDKFQWELATHEIDDRNDYNEIRMLSYAPIHGRIFAMSWTKREDQVRIISLRKANTREVKEYGQST